jgi:Metallo-beta-lactamase superfamily
VTVTTLMDNVTDVLMPDQGPARRPPRFAGGRQPAAAMDGGEALEGLVAGHGFSVLVTVFKDGSQHQILFDTGASPDGVVQNMRRLQVDPSGIEVIVCSHGHYDHHRARRLDPPAGNGEPAGAYPPAVLAPPADDPRARPARGPDHEPPGSGRRRLRGDRGPAAQLLVRPIRPGDRRGAPHQRLRARLPGATGMARRPLGAGPVDALRRSSREIVDGDRPTRRAISRTPSPCARKIAISSRSANDRYRPDSGASMTGGIPPA